MEPVFLKLSRSAPPSLGDCCVTSQDSETDHFNLSVLGDSKGDLKSTHDKIEAKLKACSQAGNNAANVNTATYQGGLFSNQI